MPSPTKKRKLNNITSSPSSTKAKGLEYFFSKQKEAKTVQDDTEVSKRTHIESGESTDMTDEELARKLQAEWDAEVVGDGDPNILSREHETEYVRPNLINGKRERDATEKSRQTTPDAISAPATPTSKAPLMLSKNQSNKTLALQSNGMADDIVTTTIPFDQSPLTFEPSKYIGELKGHWASEGGDASYALLTRCFILINATQSRIKIVDTLVNCLRVLIEADPSSLLPAVSLLPFL